MRRSVPVLLLLFLLLFSVAPAVKADAVLVHNNVVLGVVNTGNLDIWPPLPGPAGVYNYGLYLMGVGEALSPGCWCEGWGVAATAGGVRAAGFANQSAGYGGLGAGVFGATINTATSEVPLTDAPLTVTHRFGPSIDDNLFQVNVQLKNTSATATLSDVVYRRAMDWDIPPTPFSEFVTHHGVVANLESNGGNVRYASDNGFASSDPRLGAGYMISSTVNQDFVDSGPDDHGSVFDFAFGNLAPGESRDFNIFYGAAYSEADALASVAHIGAGLYSLGESNTANGPTLGTPGTFVFAFGGIGGHEPGTTPDDPILPFVPAPGEYEFPAPVPRRWYDPPFVDAFTYELTGGALFTEVGLPAFDPTTFPFSGPFTVRSGGVDGTILGTLAAGGSFFFPTGIPLFSITGISPLADAGIPTIFPTFLDWSGTGASLIMRGVEPDSTAVPEPASVVFLLTAVAGAGIAGRKRWARKAA